MKIIIVGCGKVGTTLATQLGKENNDICIVDTKRDKVQQIAAQNDIMGICGNGSNYSVLVNAGLDEADLLIAVTESDELNLLCCVIAHKAVNCKVIARVRNPVYEQESQFLRRELGLSMIINPELLCAREIFHLLCFPNAMEIGFFSRGLVEMIRFRLPQDCLIDRMSVQDVAARVSDAPLICAIERGNEVLSPTGSTILADGDIISILIERKAADSFFQKIKATKTRVRNTMVIGGGKIAVYLARFLLKTGISVKIIEQDMQRCEELSDILPDVTIVCGDGSDRGLLSEERIDEMDSFVSLTNFDEENILLSLYATKHVKEKVITKINRFQLGEVMDNINLDSVVYPKNLTSERIIQYVRAMQNSLGSNVRTLYRLCGERVEALEFTIKDKSDITDTPLAELNLKNGVLIGCIMRGSQSIIPKGQDMILSGDSIIVVTTILGLKDASDILARER